jgi:hypothetical protein
MDGEDRHRGPAIEPLDAKILPFLIGGAQGRRVSIEILGLPGRRAQEEEGGGQRRTAVHELALFCLNIPKQEV